LKQTPSDGVSFEYNIEEAYTNNKRFKFQVMLFYF
jgi:hypothetical protein